MSSSAKALGISEIVREILEYLHEDKKALYRSIRVNRCWAEQGMGILWRESPVFALCSIPRERVQFLGNFVRRLEFHGDVRRECLQKLTILRDLTLPFLRALQFLNPFWVPSLDNMAESTTTHLWEQYFQPGLADFLLNGPCKGVLQLLKGKCPRLTELSWHYVSDVESRDLVEFLETCEGLEIISYEEEPFSAVVIRHLLERKNLPKLALPVEFESEIVPRLKETLELAVEPYTHIKELEIWIELEPAMLIFPWLKSIDELEIFPTGPDVRFFGPISRLQTLRDLDVDFGENYFEDFDQIDPQDLSQLKSLKSLQKLRIAGDVSRRNNCHEFCVKPYTFFSSFPDLREFILHIPEPINLVALQVLGRSSPLLEVCRSLQIATPAEIEAAGPVNFPRLRHLELGGFDREDNQNGGAMTMEKGVQRIIQRLRDWAPILEVLETCAVSSPLDEAVVAAWHQKLSTPKYNQPTAHQR
ncbi:hypothetical protein K461DRAFT_321878 [Myriangium duriaei CBS 260.36]|uniref:F-box domain-containing protein n=1 Tax=Myriangium duriaei CBS 260.36 TaxID=1168546 RepID=A0A9P4IZB1_9PEZI|nr:hypothetical protein K461DRAFT_321878 [Myriangium duriaei CBS 260.36]